MLRIFMVLLCGCITPLIPAATTASGNNIICTAADFADGHPSELRVNFFMLQDSSNANQINVWAQLTSQVNATNLHVTQMQATPGQITVNWANGRVQTDTLPLQIVYDPNGSGSLPSGGALITSYLGNPTDGAVSTISNSGSAGPDMTVTFASGSSGSTAGSTSSSSSSSKKCGLGSGMGLLIAMTMWWRGRRRPEYDVQ